MFEFRDDRKQCTLERCQVPVGTEFTRAKCSSPRNIGAIGESYRRRAPSRCSSTQSQTIDSRLQTRRIQFSSSATTTFPRGHLTCTTIPEEADSHYGRRGQESHIHEERHETNINGQAQTKKFAGGERKVPAKSERASKWYNPEDVKKPRVVSPKRFCAP